MAKYTPSQAKSLARQIKTRFGPRISLACAGTAIPTSFLAGLISVEAGKDRQGRLQENATRFEAHVFTALRAVREGRRAPYNRIQPQHLSGASDAALKALATSYGLGQIMGWHTVNNLKCTVADLRDPAKHLGYVVELLKINSKDGDFERKDYIGEWREWNSGSETGRTHDPDYVANASAVMKAYESLPDEPEPQPTVPVPKDQPSKTSKIVTIGTTVTGLLTAAGITFEKFFATAGTALVDKPMGVVYLIAATVIVGLGIWAFNEAKKRAHERTMKQAELAADPDMSNVVMVSRKQYEGDACESEG